MFHKPTIVLFDYKLLLAKKIVKLLNPSKFNFSITINQTQLLRKLRTGEINVVILGEKIASFRNHAICKIIKGYDEKIFSIVLKLQEEKDPAPHHLVDQYVVAPNELKLIIKLEVLLHVKYYNHKIFRVNTNEAIEELGFESARAPQAVKQALLEYVPEPESFHNKLKNLNPFQLVDTQKFLWDKLTHAGISINGEAINQEYLIQRIETTTTYQRSVGCNERVDYCRGKTCLYSNPNCASNKIQRQMEFIRQVYAGIRSDWQMIKRGLQLSVDRGGAWVTMFTGGKYEITASKPNLSDTMVALMIGKLKRNNYELISNLKDNPYYFKAQNFSLPVKFVDEFQKSNAPVTQTEYTGEIKLLFVCGSFRYQNQPNLLSMVIPKSHDYHKVFQRTVSDICSLTP